MSMMATFVVELENSRRTMSIYVFKCVLQMNTEVICVGGRISVDNRKGFVRFMGELKGQKGLFCVLVLELLYRALFQVFGWESNGTILREGGTTAFTMGTDTSQHCLLCIFYLPILFDIIAVLQEPDWWIIC